MNLDAIYMTACYPSSTLYSWLRMLEEATRAPSSFVSAMRISTAGLDGIDMNLDDVIGFDNVPVPNIFTLGSCFACLRKYKLKPAPPKARPGAKQIEF